MSAKEVRFGEGARKKTPKTLETLKTLKIPKNPINSKNSKQPSLVIHVQQAP